MAKVVIGYYESEIKWRDPHDRTRFRISYVPIYKDLGPKTLTTMESELPSYTPLGANFNLWRHGSRAKERK